MFPARNAQVPAFCTNGCFPPPATTDIAITAGKIITNGSMDTVTGTVALTIRNRGPIVIDKVSFAVLYNDRTKPSGAGWNGCTNDEKYKIMSCETPAPAIGASRTITLEFTVNFAAAGGDVTVNALPGGRNDSAPADNSIKLQVCTNGC